MEGSRTTNEGLSYSRTIFKRTQYYAGDSPCSGAFESLPRNFPQRQPFHHAYPNPLLPNHPSESSRISRCWLVVPTGGFGANSTRQRRRGALKDVESDPLLSTFPPQHGFTLPPTSPYNPVVVVVYNLKAEKSGCADEKTAQDNGDRRVRLQRRRMSRTVYGAR